MSATDELLSNACLRNLGDRDYEKRKKAGLEVEQRVRERNAAKDIETINKIIRLLKRDFIESTNATHRKGGLIGLAGAAIGLEREAHLYLEKLIPPVLLLFKDPEARVRYYACEALYNLTKVLRGHVLVFFNEIFSGLCSACADVDADVKNGATLLDQLIKNVISESEHFQLAKFIPLLKEYVMNNNFNVRQLVVSWISHLDSVPDLNMLEYLPEFLSGLFLMLANPNPEIRQQANACLSEFLGEIVETVEVDFGPMVSILVEQCQSGDKPGICRITGLTWMSEFVSLARQKLSPYFPEMLGAILNCTADPEAEIRAKAEQVNAALLDLVQKSDQQVSVRALLDNLTQPLINRWEPTRLAALRWICMLLTARADDMDVLLDELFPHLLRTLSDPSEPVVRLDLEALARIGSREQRFDTVLQQLVSLFLSDSKLLETRGSLIIRQLCVLLNAERTYRTFARLLQNQEDLDFVSVMVQTLNLILMTSSELFELRSMLKQSLVSDEGRDRFTLLYKTWCHNPVATFSLCLMTQCYELGSALIFNFADIEVTVPFMMQIDKLVQLIESPIFIHLRLQLLEPQRHPFLLKSLYGLMMLLPQSSAFNYLKTRLESVSAMGMLTCIPESEFAKSSNHEIQVKETNSLNFSELLDNFRSIQKRHTALRTQVLHHNSLLTKSSEAK